MITKERAMLAAAALAVATLSGCSVGQASSGAPTTAVNSAVATARADLTGCVNKAGLFQLLTSSGRASLYSCLDNLVPSAARTTFRNCVASAALNDKIWTSAGRATFLKVDGPDCLNAAIS